MSYDIDRMIRECEKKQRPDEVICFGVGAGRIAPKIGWMKKQKAAVDFLKSLDGFIGVYPVDLWRTVIMFDTLNNAKGGKNQMNAKGIATGKYICPFLVEKKYLEGSHE